MAYDSLTSMLDTVATCYETGAYWIDAEGVDADEYQEAQITLDKNPQRTAWWLAQLPGVHRVEDLVACLASVDAPDASAHFRRWGTALGALGALRHPQTVAPLIRLLQTGQHAGRQHAAELLGDLGDAQAVEPLLQALTDPAADVRMYAAMALGHLGASQAVPALQHALQDPSDEVRDWVARALAHIHDRQISLDIS